MYHVDVAKVRGKMGEKNFSIGALSQKLSIDRNTLATYLKKPEKIPYFVLSNMATILCDTPEEARQIFLQANLRFV